jgi:hypothetical protein
MRSQNRKVSFIQGYTRWCHGDNGDVWFHAYAFLKSNILKRKQKGLRKRHWSFVRWVNVVLQMLCNDGYPYTTDNCWFLLLPRAGVLLRPWKKPPTISTHSFAPAGPNRRRKWEGFDRLISHKKNGYIINKLCGTLGMPSHYSNVAYFIL